MDRLAFPSRLIWLWRQLGPAELLERVMTDESKADREREIDPRLLSLLACPVTKRPLVYDRDRQELVSASARLAFPIRDGVPVLTLDAARHLDDEPNAASR